MTPPVSLKLPESEYFDHATLDPEIRTLIERHTREIHGLMRQTAHGIINIGLKLIEVKETLGHGNFGKWVKAELGLGTTTAWKMMRVARTFKFSYCENLDIAASALYMLAETAIPDVVRQEALDRARQGEKITLNTVEEIVAQQTIDVAAEVMEKVPASPASVHSTPKTSSQLAPKHKQAREKVAFPTETNPTVLTDFKVGDRVRILYHQNGEDNWSGKSAKIWQITLDGWLRVDVEGHGGVRFNLRPDWVERMEETSEQQERTLIQDWADEPDSESLAISNVSSGEQNEAVPRIQAGDRLQVTNLGQQNQEWIGEVAEVVAVSEGCVRVTVEIVYPTE